MTATLTASKFSYDALEPEVCTLVSQATAEIHIMLRRSISDIFQVGGMLAQVKASLPHGQWGNWLDHEFGWSDDTARNMIRVHEVFKNRNFRDLDVAPSAFYLLASPSTPEVAREAALERAANGEKITNAKAKEIIGAAKELEVDPEPEPATPANQPTFDELFADLPRKGDAPEPGEPVEAEWEDVESEENESEPVRCAVPEAEEGDQRLAEEMNAFFLDIVRSYRVEYGGGHPATPDKCSPFNTLTAGQLKLVRGGLAVAHNFLGELQTRIQEQLLVVD